MSEIIVGFVGVLVGAFVSGMKDWIFLRNRKVDQARYIAIRVVCILDRFIEEASNAACDEGIEDHTGLTVGHQFDDPVTLDFDDSWSWEALPADLMYRTLILPSEVESAERSIGFAFSETAGPPDYSEGYDVRRTRYANLGLKALQLTDEFREKYKTPPREGVGSDPKKLFDKTLDEVKESQERAAKSMRELMGSEEIAEKE